MEVMISGMIAMRRSRRKISARGFARGRIASPKICPAMIPRKKPRKIYWVSDKRFKNRIPCIELLYQNRAFYLHPYLT